MVYTLMGWGVVGKAYHKAEIVSYDLRQFHTKFRAFVHFVMVM